MRKLIATCILACMVYGAASAAIRRGDPEPGSDAWVKEGIRRKELAPKFFTEERNKRCHGDQTCILGFDGLVYIAMSIERPMLHAIGKIPPGQRTTQLQVFYAFNTASDSEYSRLVEQYPDDATAAAEQTQTR